MNRENEARLNPSMGGFLLMMLRQGIEESERDEKIMEEYARTCKVGNKENYQEAAYREKGRNWAYKSIKKLVEDFCLQESK